MVSSPRRAGGGRPCPSPRKITACMKRGKSSMSSMRTRKATLGRRAFVGAAAGGLASTLAGPLILPSRVWAAAPSKRLRVGQIGCGRIAQVHDLPETLESNLADVVAVCDVDGKRAAEGRSGLEKYYQSKERPLPPIAVYRSYRELLAHADVDAVVISTPDHWHAELALAAVRAGKDVYMQKPFTLTLAEGIALR